MADSNDELIVKIGADFKQLKAELDKAGNSVKGFSEKGKKSLESIVQKSKELDKDTTFNTLKTELEKAGGDYEKLSKKGIAALRKLNSTTKTSTKKSGDSVAKLDKEVESSTKGVSKSFKDLDKNVEKSAKGFRGSTNGMLGSIKRLRADLGAVKFAIGAATAVAGLYVNRAAESAIETERWAMRLGMSASELSKLSNVAQLGGANLDDLTDTMKEVAIKAGEAAEGNEGYRKTFQTLGIDARTFAQLPMEQQFRALADAVSTTDVEARELIRAVDDLASDAGVRMIETLKKGSKGIDEMGKSAAVTAASLSDFDFQQIKEAKAQMDRFKLSITALANALTVQLAPAMQGLGVVMDAVSDSMKVDESAAKKRLAQIREEKKAYADTGNTFKEFSLLNFFYNREVGKKIKLMQEEVKLINLLAAAEESRAQKSNKSGAAKIAEGDLGARFKPEEDEPPIEGESMWRQYFADKQEVIEEAKKVSHEKANEWRKLELDREKDAAIQNTQMWESGLEGRAQVTSKVLGDMSKMMGSKNKEMFKIGKMAAMAQVAIDTPKAAMSAYSALAGIPIVGPAMGAAAAAAAISSGMTQLSNIKSQSFQGGGGGGGGASAGGMTGAAATAEAPTQVLETNVTFSGGGDVSQDQFRGFVNGLNDALDDGMSIGRITA